MEPLDRRISVRLTPSDRLALDVLAGRLGKGPTTLAREWVLRALRQAERGGRKTGNVKRET